jgi:hypothetical protein
MSNISGKRTRMRMRMSLRKRRKKGMRGACQRTKINPLLDILTTFTSGIDITTTVVIARFKRSKIYQTAHAIYPKTATIPVTLTVCTVHPTLQTPFTGERKNIEYQDQMIVRKNRRRDIHIRMAPHTRW